MSDMLLIHPGALGDLVLFGRLCRMVDKHVTLVAHGRFGRLLSGLGVVERAIDFESLPMHEVFSESPPDQCRLTQLLGGYDRLISCLAAGDRAAELRLSMLCGASSAAFLPVRPGRSFRGHLLELWCDLLGEPVDELPQDAWKVPAEWKKDAGGVDADIVIHPGAGSRAKCWPLERFVELSRRLRAERKTDSLFVLGEAEVEWWGQGTLRRISEAFPTLINPPLETLAAILSRCRGYVGNDSGVSHLAAAVGAPSVVLFGPSNAVHFRPLGPKVRIISKRALSEIAVDEVISSL